MIISVVVPVCAYPNPKDLGGPPHPQLARMLDSVVEAMHVADDAPADLVAARDSLMVELLIGTDGDTPLVRQAIEEWRRRQRTPRLVVRVEAIEPAEAVTWGNRQRNALMVEAVGDLLYFQDQDDRFFPGSLVGIARDAALHPGQPLIYKMQVYQYGNHSAPRQDPDVLWRERGRIEQGHIGGHMFVTPNRQDLLGRWEPETKYEADFAFIRGTLDAFAAEGIEPWWGDGFVSMVRPYAVGL